MMYLMERNIPKVDLSSALLPVQQVIWHDPGIAEDQTVCVTSFLCIAMLV